MAKKNPVPTIDEFAPALAKAMEDALDSLAKGDVHVPSGISKQLAAVRQRVADRLQKAGEEYGEELLFLTGENALVNMAVWKSLRNLHGAAHLLTYEQRKDNWLDLAGYALLAMAMEEYKQQNVGKTKPTKAYVVYLAGAITNIGQNVAQARRNRLAEALVRSGLVCYSPPGAWAVPLKLMRDRDTISKLQGTNDNALLDSDLVLVDVTGVSSPGTDAEIKLAMANGIPVLAFASPCKGYNNTVGISGVTLDCVEQLSELANTIRRKIGAQKQRTNPQ